MLGSAGRGATKKYEVIDACRKNLVHYTTRAFSRIPAHDRPLILDAGCGTGVPSLALINACNGTIYAVDPDEESISRFRVKVDTQRLNDRIMIINDSILNPSLFDFRFDIVLAEGLLNVIGFEKGLGMLARFVKTGGHLIVHDELKDDAGKRVMFRSRGLELLDSFVLDENVWWSEYYGCLEKGIQSAGRDELFEKELGEIREYKSNPRLFKSIYYILQKK